MLYSHRPNAYELKPSCSRFEHRAVDGSHCHNNMSRERLNNGLELLWWIKRLSLDGILELMVALEIFNQYGRTHVRRLPSLMAYIKTLCGLRSLSTVLNQHLSKGVKRRFYKN
nr:hypothetical protein [Tanacetum cinerariifolium]